MGEARIVCGEAIKEMQTTINIGGEKHLVASGLISAKLIYEAIHCEGGRLFLSRSDDIDVPVFSSEYLCRNI